jgi:hypothetical protein
MNNENSNRRDGRDGNDRFGGNGDNHKVSGDRAGGILHVDDGNRVGLAKATAIAVGLILYPLAARVFRFDPFKD